MVFRLVVPTKAARGEECDRSPRFVFALNEPDDGEDLVSASAHGFDVEVLLGTLALGVLNATR